MKIGVRSTLGLLFFCLLGCSPLVGIYLIQSAETGEAEPTPTPSPVAEQVR